MLHDTRLDQPYLEEEVWRMQKADWNLYSEMLEQKMAQTLLSSFSLDTEEYVKFICDSITEAAEGAIPRTKTKRNRKRRWRLTEEARLWHHQISRATKAFKSNPSEDTLRELRELQRDASVCIKESRNLACEEWVQSLNNMNGKELWGEIKRLKGKNKTFLYSNVKNEALKLLDDFTNRGNLDRLPLETQSAVEDRYNDRLNALIRNIQYKDDTDAEITFDELEMALNISKKTAPGHDGLPYPFYTHTKLIFRQALLKLFNAIYKDRVWPNSWKVAIIIPIPKPSGEGLRPVSLLTCMSKIFESVIHKRIVYKLPQFEEAYGYTQGRWTIDAVVRFMD